MSDKATPKGLRDEMGDGFLNLLDSVRHSFEQAAWGQETTGNLGDDFFRWVGPAEDAPRPMDGAELGGGVEVQPATLEASAEDWNEFAAWIDGKRDAPGERGIEAERGREGPSREGPELGE